MAGGDDASLPEDEDLDALQPSKLARIAGLSLGATGVFTLILALQTYAALVVRNWIVAVPPAMGLFGASAVFLGARTAVLRGWAAISGTAVASVLGLAVLAWNIFAFVHGYVSLLALAIVPASAASAALSAAAIPAGLRADKARMRLGARGLKAGF